MPKLLRDNKPLMVYFIIVALTAFGLSLSNDVLHNYFKDAYNVTAYERGLIEFPRESPGVLLVAIIAILATRLSDIRIARLAQFFSAVGIVVLGLFTPSYGWMLVFLFINSLGMHMFFPLQESIGLSLVSPENTGRRMGQFKGVATAFLMLGYGLVFLGFRQGFFSFKTQVKGVFLIAGAAFVLVFLLFIYLEKLTGRQTDKDHKLKLYVRKEYRYYYMLVTMYGVQKQMMMVYGPWVLIDILSKGPDTMAILSMIGAFIGIFFLPAVGRWIDRFGIKTLLYADALSFIGVYALYGFMSGRLYDGTFSKVGWPVAFMFVLFIIDKMSTQLGMVRSVYLKSILVDEKDLTPTLSLGISMDHVMSVVFAILGGLVWSTWGPQYIFYLVAFLSLTNLFVAIRVAPQKPA